MICSTRHWIIHFFYPSLLLHDLSIEKSFKSQFDYSFLSCDSLRIVKNKKKQKKVGHIVPNSQILTQGIVNMNDRAHIS